MIKLISLQHLETGMYVCNKPDSDNLELLQKSGFVQKQQTIDKFKKAQIKELWIDTEKGKDSPFAIPVKRKAVITPKVPLKQEKPQAEKLFNQTKTALKKTMESAKLGKSISMEAINQISDGIQESLENNHHALLTLTQIRNLDAYQLEHAVSSAVLMGVFARYLGYEGKTLNSMIIGALFHDIGNVKVPYEILTKPAKLNSGEVEIVVCHVENGAKVINEIEGLDQIALDMCNLHHERVNGSGYPKGLQEKDINIYGRLIAIVDVYDAITTNRVYCESIPPNTALKTLLEQAGSAFDGPLLYEFIRCLSIYPSGTLVELTNGRIGVVTCANTRLVDRPVVTTFYNINQKCYETPVSIDLSKPRHNLKIKSTRDPKDYGINIADFI